MRSNVNGPRKRDTGIFSPDSSMPPPPSITVKPPLGTSQPNQRHHYDGGQQIDRKKGNRNRNPAVFLSRIAADKNPNPTFIPGKTPLTMDEVKKHQIPGDMWTVLRGKVYNIAPYVDYHPGGGDILIDLAAGQDCTDEFEKHHPWISADGLLGKCCLGPLQRNSSSNIMGHGLSSSNLGNRTSSSSSSSNLGPCYRPSSSSSASASSLLTNRLQVSSMDDELTMDDDDDSNHLFHSSLAARRRLIFSPAGGIWMRRYI